jgi:hypothetical protein
MRRLICGRPARQTQHFAVRPRGAIGDPRNLSTINFPLGVTFPDLLRASQNIAQEVAAKAYLVA